MSTRYTAEMVLGFDVASMGVVGCVDLIIGWVDSGEKSRYLACVNPHSIEVARKDRGFDRALKSADILIPDGAGIVVASKMLGGSIAGRVTGSDIFSGVSRALNKKGGVRYFFLGSSNEALAKIRTRMESEFPCITVAGTFSPPFREEFSENETEEMVQRVNESASHVLWVGMTAPKQEKWIWYNRNKMNVKFIGAIGAVFDFYSGNVRRSHPFFQRLGLEWLPRLFREPGRLWRRTMVSAPRFIIHIVQERFGSK